MRIIEIVATRCQILRLKCTKFDFGWGSVPDPAGGAYSAPPEPLDALKGPTSRGWEKVEGKGRRGQGWEVSRLLILIPPGCRGTRIVSALEN